MPGPDLGSGCRQVTSRLEEPGSELLFARRRPGGAEKFEERALPEESQVFGKRVCDGVVPSTLVAGSRSAILESCKAARVECNGSLGA